jgi:hypothetical protein
MTTVPRMKVKASMELAEKMRMLTGKAFYTKDDYQDIAIAAATLAGQTRNILTSIELHRTAHLCATAAGLDGMAKAESNHVYRLMIDFNDDKELDGAKAGRDDPNLAKLEYKLARVARFTPMLSALRTENDGGQEIIEVAMGINSEPDEKFIPESFKKVGILGVFLREQGRIGGEDQRPRA